MSCGRVRGHIWVEAKKEEAQTPLEPDTSGQSGRRKQYKSLDITNSWLTLYFDVWTTWCGHITHISAVETKTTTAKRNWISTRPKICVKADKLERIIVTQTHSNLLLYVYVWACLYLPICVCVCVFMYFVYQITTQLYIKPIPAFVFLHTVACKSTCMGVNILRKSIKRTGAYNR